MIRILLITLLFLLTGCGRGVLLDTTFFTSYVQTFEKESRAYGHPKKVTNLTIKFSEELPEDIVGRCQGTNDRPLILINAGYWDTLSVDQKEILLFHEMGHCLLGLYHDDTKPSIMRSRLLGGYGGNRDGLLTDYFGSIDVHSAMRYHFNKGGTYAGCR